MSPLKPISISLSPNTEKDDVQLASKLIRQPKNWREGEKNKELEEEFKKYLGVNYTFSFNSGRSAFLAILEALGIKEGDEVLLQAFTCNAAVNPILEVGARPVFVDIDNTLNIDPVALRKKITPNSKIVIIQHTFGWPAQIDKILEIVKEYNLILIEDAAHALGAQYQGKFCGTFGDAAFFSLGRDKIISSIFGGMAVTNNQQIAKKIKEFHDSLDYPSNFWIFQQLLHPTLINYLILPAYGLSNNLGRILLGAFHRLSVLSKAVYKEEKRGKIPEYFPKRLPNALSILALNQFRKLARFNRHRREIANFYQKELKNTNLVLPLAGAGKDRVPTFMRYPVLVNFDTDELLRKLRRRKIFLDDGWRKSPIVPPDTKLETMKYIKGSCPQAEKVVQSIVNLPTNINISRKDAQKIIDFLKRYETPKNKQ